MWHFLGYGMLFDIYLVVIFSGLALMGSMRRFNFILIFLSLIVVAISSKDDGLTSIYKYIYTGIV